MLKSAAKLLNLPSFTLLSGAWLAFLLMTIVLVGYSLHSSYLSPRPYYVQPHSTDIENDYVYNSKKIIETGTPYHILHPGTPVQYLGAGIMALVGTDIERTQTFLNVGYVVILITTIGSFAAFTKIALAKSSFPVALLSLGALMIWPPLLSYMNYWGSEAFLICIGLVATAMVWPSIDQNREPRAKENIILGILVGIGLAVKFTFVPLALILVITMTAMGISKRLRINGIVGWKPSVWLLFREPILIWAPALIVVVLATSPVILRSHQLFAAIYRVRRIDPRLNTEDSFTSLMNDLTDPTPLVISVIGIVLFMIVVGLVIPVLKIGITNKKGAPIAGHPNFSRIGVVALVLSFATIGVSYGLGVAAPFVTGENIDSGTKLREYSAVAVVVPILVLCAHRVSVPVLRNIWSFQSQSKVIQSVLVMLCVGAILATTWSYAGWRANSVESEMYQTAAFAERLEELAIAGTRIAFGETSFIGVPGFHLYADSRYTADYFEDQLASDLEHYAFLRPTQLHYHRLAAEGIEPDDPAVIRATGLLGILESKYQNWLAAWPIRKPSSNVISGDENGLPISVFVYSDELKNSGRLGDTDLEIQNTIEDIFGEISDRESHYMDGANWNIVVFHTPN